jgi:uncharacterized protein YbaP (TraB family)
MIGRQLLALAGAVALAACGTSERDWPAPSPALWEVTGPDGSHGWLFGTIHALPDGAEWRTPRLDAALDDAGVLVVEVAALGDEAAASEAFEAVASSPGLPPLLQRVPAVDRPMLAGALDRAGIDEADLARTESWAAALLIANRARQGEADNGVDRGLLAQGLPVIGLESHAVQFALFDGLAEDDQAVLLAETAREAAEARGDRLAEAWLTGDLAVLEREMQRGILADPELRRVLLTARNAAWAERVAGLLAAQRRPFVAVGAAHLLGDEGLPALLAGRGYTVRRIQ